MSLLNWKLAALTTVALVFMAFQNPDKTIAVILRNETSWSRTINIAIAGQKLFASMQPDSFNTLLLQS